MYPGEIENYISSRYKNIDFAVTGIKERYLGEKPLFCYSQNTPVNNLLFSKILTDLKKEFEDYKVPREKLELLEIPRTTNGKVQRKRLKKILENKLTNEN
jgi:acyl-coenzyme A synthetase/AMP-(fatty) acid ligase